MSTLPTLLKALEIPALPLLTSDWKSQRDVYTHASGLELWILGLELRAYDLDSGWGLEI